MNLAPTLSSRRQDWRTPRSLFERLHERYRFNVDLFASSHDAHLKIHFFNALTHSWESPDKAWAGAPTTPTRGFGNPEYGPFVRRALAKAALREAELAVMLVPARVCTGYWRKHVWPVAHEVLFYPGRITFDSTCFHEGCFDLAAGVVKNPKGHPKVKARFKTAEGKWVERPLLCERHLEPLRGSWDTGPLEPAPFDSALVIYRHASEPRPEGYARVSHLEL